MKSGLLSRLQAQLMNRMMSRVRDKKLYHTWQKAKVGCTASDASGVWTVFKAVSLSILRRLASDK